MQGGREFSLYADGVRAFCQPSPAGEGGARSVTDEVLLQYIAKENLISLCSHTDMRPNLNREVCHSLTWHSSKSESALERFEPVAVVCYSGTVGALCSHRSPRGDRRCLKEGLTHMRSMCVGVAETGVNTFLFLSFSFFSDKRKEL